MPSASPLCSRRAMALRSSSGYPHRVRYAVLLGAATALLMTLSGLAPTSAQIAVDRPIITVEPEILDFGVMPQNESRSGEITIHNIGGALLKIREVKSDCGCTVADITQREIASGESTTLSVTFNSQKFEGQQTKYIQVYSNDPDTPVLEYVVSAKVKVPVYVKPVKRQLAFGRLRQGESNTQRAWFETEDIAQLEITPSRFNEQLFTIEVDQNPEGQANRAVLTVHSKPDAPVGDHREFIRVETNVPDLPLIDFEAFLTVLQDLEAFPAKVDLRYAQRNRPFETLVRVRATSKNVEFKVTGAEIDLPNFKAEVEETIPNVETFVHLTGMPVTRDDPLAVQSEGRIQGTLRIFTNLPQQPELIVPVRYLLKM